MAYYDYSFRLYTAGIIFYKKTEPTPFYSANDNIYEIVQKLKKVLDDLLPLITARKNSWEIQRIHAEGDFILLKPEKFIAFNLFGEETIDLIAHHIFLNFKYDFDTQLIEYLIENNLDKNE